MATKMITLTAAHKKAGIVAIYSRNYNGSFTCEVDLRKVDIDNTDANPRRFSAQHLRKINHNFNRLVVRNPTLWLRKGIISTIDGRHTTNLLLDVIASNDTTKPIIMSCEVFFNITAKEANIIFLERAVNNKRISPWDAHICGLRAEYPINIKIQEILDKHSLKCPNDAGYNARSADVTAFDVLKEACLAGGQLLERLCHVLNHVYRDIDGRVEKSARQYNFVGGLLDLLHTENYKTWTVDNIVRCLMRRDANWIYKEALASVQDSGCGSDRPARPHYLNAFIKAMELGTRQKAA